jgi:hypothetical protein
MNSADPLRSTVCKLSVLSFQKSKKRCSAGKEHRFLLVQ